jgi:hypothetical protein
MLPFHQGGYQWGAHPTDRNTRQMPGGMEGEYSGGPTPTGWPTPDGTCRGVINRIGGRGS